MRRKELGLGGNAGRVVADVYARRLSGLKEKLAVDMVGDGISLCMMRID